MIKSTNMIFYLENMILYNFNHNSNEISLTSMFSVLYYNFDNVFNNVILHIKWTLKQIYLKNMWTLLIPQRNKIRSYGYVQLYLYLHWLYLQLYE